MTGKGKHASHAVPNKNPMLCHPLIGVSLTWNLNLSNVPTLMLCSRVSQKIIEIEL
jgi:hypothetical protein